MSATTILGHSIDRREDPGLLTGSTSFLADLSEAGHLHAVFVRSHTAHGTITSIEVAEAADAAGVEAVFTGADLGLPPARAFGREPELARPLLATERVRYVGEPIAVVVADSLAAAVDAAELVVVDIEPLRAVVDVSDALDPDAPLLFPDHGSNVVLDIAPEGVTDDLFADADVVVSAELHHNRVAPVTMENNGVLAIPDGTDAIEVWVSTQSVFGVRNDIHHALGLDEENVRVRAAAIGGGFGAKGGVYPEQVVVAAIAHRLSRPVRWAETRSENLTGMTHGRASVHRLEVGARSDGTIVGLRVRVIGDAGAYSARGVFIPFVTQRMGSGAYRIPRIEVRPTVVVTNTTPTGPYRGAGRPEAAAMCERAIDLVAAELGLDPVEVRRRNHIAPEAFPYTTPTGATYDSGDYGAALDLALEMAGYDQLRAEQARRRSERTTRQLGIGMSTYVEISGQGSEFGSVTVEPDGSVTVVTGSVPHGQSHETVWAQIASSVLGVPVDRIAVVHSDTRLVDHGTGTFGSRSLQLAGSAVQTASTEVLDRARRVVADHLEASPDDIAVLDDGRVGVVGTPATAADWDEVVALAADAGVELTTALDFEQPATFPFGAHVAVVEVDTDTGRVDLARLVGVDDCGRVVSPTLAEGQVHGGMAQGIAQMLFEQVVFDADGTPLTATLADYGVPSAADLVSFETAHTETPSPNNPLGAKGIGESGTTGSISAVWNAVVDALAPYGVEHLDPPFTPEKVWRALRSGPVQGRTARPA
ncbi:MAG: xanthine dehydrogenase family protein molybdopterin-binding subunit [Acidimicrobiales bacterium]